MLRPGAPRSAPPGKNWRALPADRQNIPGGWCRGRRYSRTGRSASRSASCAPPQSCREGARSEPPPASVGQRRRSCRLWQSQGIRGRSKESCPLAPDVGADRIVSRWGATAQGICAGLSCRVSLYRLKTKQANRSDRRKTSALLPLSPCGPTDQQACAASKRECIRVNITIETDEDDLLGGYRLQDGQTVWQNGPVIEAMERGAVLLLDEIDLASNKIMCLQPILEGNGVFIKKINKFVKPANGFNVIATANTKGQGSEDGKFIGTNILNEAFLERFPITVEQSYPSNKNEIKMLDNVMTQKGLTKDIDKKFAENLITWADIIRKTFYEGGVDEIISTRRLVHIVDAYAIFKDKMKSIQMCTNRFDNDTKTSFIDLYTKIDGGEDVSTWLNTSETEEQDSDDSEEGNVSY